MPAWSQPHETVPVTFYQPHQVVLAVAHGLRFVREEPRDSNRGQAVEAMLKVTGLGPGYAWCAAMVAWCGNAALGSDWPLPLTASVAALGAAGEQKRLLRQSPKAGDVFLVWFPSLHRFAHTGFVRGVRADGTVETTEGNTNDGGSRDGWGLFERTRKFTAADRFIRWEDAL